MTDSEALAFKILHLEQKVAELETSRKAITKESVRVFKLAAEEREQLIKERDEARREVCNLSIHLPRDYALERGWDCFKEDTND